jgi:hypothetical protein
MSPGEHENSKFEWLDSADPSGSLKRYDLNSSRLSCSLWVAPNPALRSRMPDLPHHCTNMAELLTLLFQLGDFPCPQAGGNLRVRLGSLWVFDGEGGSLTSPIDLTLNYKSSVNIFK